MTSIPSVSARKKLLFSVIATLLACAVGATIWEIVLRVEYSRWRERYDNYGLFGWLTRPSDDPELMWEYKPYGSTPDLLGPIRVNGFGFRERDLATSEKPAGTFRIAVIGDSVTLGMKVKEERTFVRQVEARIHGALGRRDVQVLNFSVDGYDAIQIERMLVSKVMPFAPDLVVYALCLNDFDHEISSGEKTKYFRPPKLFVWKALADAIVALRVQSVGYHEYVFQANKQPVYAAIRRMRRDAEAQRCGFAVAILPLFPLRSKHGLFQAEPSGSMRAYPASWAAIVREIGEFLAHEGIPAVDLCEPFADVEDPASVATDIWHPNEHGHELIAARLFQYLVDQRSLEKRPADVDRERPLLPSSR